MGAVFDTVALLGLQTGHPEVALVLSVVTGALAVAAWWLLPGVLRRHPEPVAWIVTMGVAISTVATGLAVPRSRSRRPATCWSSPASSP